MFIGQWKLAKSVLDIGETCIAPTSDELAKVLLKDYGRLFGLPCSPVEVTSRR